MLLKEQEAIAAKENAARKAELTLKFLKDKLAQEEVNTRINMQKIDAQWRAILRKEKSEDIQQELDILSQTFERVLDRKQAIIQALVQDIIEAEQQDHMASQSHVLNLDKLLLFQQKRLQELHTEFNEELQALKDEFLSERDALITMHEKEISDIKDIIFAMEMLHKDQENEAAVEFNSKRDEIRTKNLEARSTLKATLETQVGELWDQFQAALKGYEHNTAEKKAEFERLREKDKQSAATIDAQTRKLNRLQDAIQASKQRIAATQREFDQRNRELKHEKETILVHFQQLKGQMSKSRGRERQELIELTVQSREASDTLRKRIELAEQILRQAEICRKLETEEEKILPFYAESVSAEELAAAGAHLQPDEVTSISEKLMPVVSELSADALDAQGHSINSIHSLDNFWKRYNKGLLDKLAVEHELKILNDENEQLRALLKRYLDGISVNEEVIAQDNSLFVVNGRTNAPVPVADPRVKRSNVAVEAIEVVNSTQKMGLRL